MKYTFQEFIEYGLDRTDNIVNGLPWTFDFYGYSVTHENDDCYLLVKHNRTIRFTKGEIMQFCEKCCDTMNCSIAIVEKEKEVKGKIIKYIGKHAYCNECQHPVFIPEIRDYNLDALDMAYVLYYVRDGKEV